MSTPPDSFGWVGTASQHGRRAGPCLAVLKQSILESTAPGPQTNTRPRDTESRCSSLHLLHWPLTVAARELLSFISTPPDSCVWRPNTQGHKQNPTLETQSAGAAARKHSKALSLSPQPQSHKQTPTPETQGAGAAALTGFIGHRLWRQVGCFQSVSTPPHLYGCQHLRARHRYPT